MNQKNITIAAVIATSLLMAVIATTTLPFAYAQDSSETSPEQKIKQKQVQSGFITTGEQDALNCIPVSSGDSEQGDNDCLDNDQ